MTLSKAEYQHAYYIANRERIKAYNRENGRRWEERRNKLAAETRRQKVINGKSPPVLAECDAAYIAAFIDGEGSISLFKRNAKNRKAGLYAACVQISNTDLDNLEWIRDRVGGSMVIHNPDDGRRRQSYKLSLTSRQTSDVLPVLLPYLRQKAERARLVLIACAIIQSPNRSSKRLGYPYGTTRREHPPLLGEIYERMRNLNRRGSLETS